jgi:hypothetical protein
VQRRCGWRSRTEVAQRVVGRGHGRSWSCVCPALDQCCTRSEVCVRGNVRQRESLRRDSVRVVTLRVGKAAASLPSKTLDLTLDSGPFQSQPSPEIRTKDDWRSASSSDARKRLQSLGPAIELSSTTTLEPRCSRSALQSTGTGSDQSSGSLCYYYGNSKRFSGPAATSSVSSCLSCLTQESVRRNHVRRS